LLATPQKPDKSPERFEDALAKALSLLDQDGASSLPQAWLAEAKALVVAKPTIRHVAKDTAAESSDSDSGTTRSAMSSGASAEESNVSAVSESGSDSDTPLPSTPSKRAPPPQQPQPAASALASVKAAAEQDAAATRAVPSRPPGTFVLSSPQTGLPPPSSIPPMPLLSLSEPDPEAESQSLPEDVMPPEAHVVWIQEEDWDEQAFGAHGEPWHVREPFCGMTKSKRRLPLGEPVKKRLPSWAS
jgi:hypothetical protein